jgi:hypothetical protein
MVQGQTKPVYKAPSYGTKDQADCKKSQFDFKPQERKGAIPKTNAFEQKKTSDPWGKTFKNEAHFKGLHIC